MPLFLKDMPILLYMMGTRQDFFAFQTEVAHQLIGSFHFGQRAGYPSSGECATAAQLNVQLNHWPVQVEKKLECVVCNTKRTKQQLSWPKMRHESQFICSQCNVHLCISIDRDCFKSYQTKVEDILYILL